MMVGVDASTTLRKDMGVLMILAAQVILKDLYTPLGRGGRCAECLS
jgi:hypothetical protein